MEIRFDPPTLTGSPAEQLEQLKRWVTNLCEKLNVIFAMLEDKGK